MFLCYVIINETHNDGSLSSTFISSTDVFDPSQTWEFSCSLIKPSQDLQYYKP